MSEEFVLTKEDVIEADFPTGECGSCLQDINIKKKVILAPRVCLAVQELKQRFCKRFWYPECCDGVEFVCPTKANESKIVDGKEVRQCPACDAIDGIFECCVENKEDGK